MISDYQNMAIYLEHRRSTLPTRCAIQTVLPVLLKHFRIGENLDPIILKGCQRIRGGRPINGKNYDIGLWVSAKEHDKKRSSV